MLSTTLSVKQENIDSTLCTAKISTPAVRIDLATVERSMSRVYENVNQQKCPGASMGQVDRLIEMCTKGRRALYQRAIVAGLVTCCSIYKHQGAVELTVSASCGSDIDPVVSIRTYQATELAMSGINSPPSSPIVMFIG